MTRAVVNVDACGTIVGAPAGTLELRLDSPAGPQLASFDITVNDNGPYCPLLPVFKTFEAPITDPGGTHRLYLVPQGRTRRARPRTSSTSTGSGSTARASAAEPLPSHSPPQGAVK